jgi:hypothetical protein
MDEKLESNKNSSFAGLYLAGESKCGENKKEDTSKVMLMVLIAMTATEIYRKVSIASKLRKFFCSL